MSMTGLSRGVDVTWPESQLAVTLHSIICQYRNYYNCESASAADVETESDDYMWVSNRTLSVPVCQIQTLWSGSATTSCGWLYLRSRHIYRKCSKNESYDKFYTGVLKQKFLIILGHFNYCDRCTLRWCKMMWLLSMWGREHSKIAKWDYPFLNLCNDNLLTVAKVRVLCLWNNRCQNLTPMTSEFSVVLCII